LSELDLRKHQGRAQDRAGLENCRILEKAQFIRRLLRAAEDRPG